MGTNDYFARDMIGLNKNAKEVLAEVYLNRRKPFTDKVWVDLYKRWLLTTDKSMHGEGYDLSKLRTKAAYYFEKVALGGEAQTK